MRAKVFMSGGSQAVRLPAEYRFDCEEVDVRRDALTGDLVLSKPRKSWEDFFDWLDTIDPSPDFLMDRHQPVDDFRNPFAPRRAKPSPAKPKRVVADRRRRSSK